MLMRQHPEFGDGTRVFKSDETATSTVHDHKRIVAEKGVKQVYKATSGEKGTNVTTVSIISASGSKDHMTQGASPDTMGLATRSGAGPSHAFLSPEYFRGYPKAGKLKTDREQRKKGKSMIATSHLDMRAIAEKKKLIPTSRILSVKRKVFVNQPKPKEKKSSSSSFIRGRGRRRWFFFFFLVPTKRDL
ncbi:hypothetical protein JTB14_031363 [Gonioctena quinquepunctata]|nr:hypothetical protein JTB14_031363 [Gonioctena quinquepunctata]